MAIGFCISAGFIWFSWNRWNARLAKMAATASTSSGILVLDNDGIRTISQSGASNFVPWSSYRQWKEGKNVFVLTGSDGAAIIPIDDGYRDNIRMLLASKIN